MARADILYRDGNGGHVLCEVKSSSPPATSNHVMDACYQYHVLTQAGLNITRVEVLLLNRGYVREGDLNPRELFVAQDVTDKAIKYQDFIRNALEEARVCDSILDVPPPVELEDARIANLTDDEVLHYRPDLRTADSVLLMPKSGTGRRKNIALANKLADREGGVSSVNLDGAVLDELAAEMGRKKKGGHPENENKLKAAFRVATATQGVICQTQQIVDSLGKIELPAVFIDFETYLSALPPHDGCRPNDQVPFLVSMIRIEEGDSKPKVSTFIADPDKGDPRRFIANSILDGCKGAKSLVAYNATFEKTVMRNLAKVLPAADHKRMMKLVTKFQDIAEVFRQGHFYHPEQYGKTGLKRVAGVLLEKRPYDGLEVTNGAMAAGAYLKAISGDVTEWPKVREQLKKYCDVDVQNMIDVVAAMENYAGLPKDKRRFEKHAVIKVRKFGQENILDADPRTVVEVRAHDEISHLTNTGKEVQKRARDEQRELKKLEATKNPAQLNKEEKGRGAGKGRQSL